MRFILCLGVVSLFADMTYEGAHSIIGPYLRDLGATGLQVATIAGVGEMLAASLRFFSGRFADRTRAYWAITFCGYAMNVVAVPALAWASNWRLAAILIVAERTGKALRGRRAMFCFREPPRRSATDGVLESTRSWTRPGP
jgi:hypothetical protein